MKVLVVGGGAREHALCLALSKDPAVTAIVCAPGNPGIAELADCRPLDVTDPDAVGDLAIAVRADLTVVGPEVPLVAGAAEACRSLGAPAFGPDAAAAELEGSKAFAKDVMRAAGVHTAAGRDHRLVQAALADLDEFGPPYVVKYDGLAAGKGVTVTDDHDTAAAAVRAALRGPDDRVVIEEYLDGPEVSLFCVVTEDGTVVPLPPAQDFKRVGDGDTGSNTGGMGAYAPLPWTPPGFTDEIVRTVVRPTVAEMAKRDTPFSGLLYTGLALTAKGPRVVEFNVRFGDPETQVVLPLLAAPLTEVLAGTAEPTLLPGAAVTVVIAAHGYPESPRAGDEIRGLAAANAVPGVSVQHAGTALAADGRLVTAGGRVLSVTAVGPDLAAARQSAYQAVELIDIDGAHYRSDIALAAATGRTAEGTGT